MHELTKIDPLKLRLVFLQTKKKGMDRLNFMEFQSEVTKWKTLDPKNGEGLTEEEDQF